MWPSPATAAADLWPTPPPTARNYHESVRANDPNLRTVKHLQRGEIEKSRGFRTRCSQWKRTQRIRTAAAIPVEALFVDQREVPVYLRIADKAKLLRNLGMSDKAVARALGVSDKTVAKAVDAAGLPTLASYDEEGSR